MSVFYLRIIKAYTFLEIIVVVGITGILAGTSVLSAGKFLDFIDKRNFERTFQQQLISLQTQALIRGEDIYIDFDTDELGETGKYFVSYFQSGSFVISDTLLSSSRFLVRTDFDISASTDAFVLHGVSDRDEVVTKDIVVSDTGSVLSFDDDLQTLTLSLIPESTSTEFQEYLRLFRYSSGHIDSPIYIDTLSVYDTVLWSWVSKPSLSLYLYADGRRMVYDSIDDRYFADWKIFFDFQGREEVFSFSY